uniref:Uncharacterized protein n=1 Tax=Adineta vaga TaxID=104782 RepID=B3G4B8_ADIVA|nr:unknown [Adineta vaga]
MFPFHSLLDLLHFLILSFSRIHKDMSTNILFSLRSLPRTRPYKRRFRTIKSQTSNPSISPDSVLKDYIQFINRLEVLSSTSTSITTNNYITTYTTFTSSSIFPSLTTDFITEKSTSLYDVQNVTMTYHTTGHSITKILHSILFSILQQEGNIWKYALCFTLFCFVCIILQTITRHVCACYRTYFPIRKHHPPLQEHSSTSEHFTTLNNTRIQNNNNNKLSLAPNQISLGGSIITFLSDDI